MRVVEEQAAALGVAARGLPTMKAWPATAKEAAPKAAQ